MSPVNRDDKQKLDGSPARSKKKKTSEGDSSKTQLIHPYISQELHKKVRLYCIKKGISTSKFTEAAFQEYLSSTSDSGSILKKLDRYYHKMEVIDSNLHILSEAFGLFLQYWFAHTPAIQDNDKKMASYNGKQRYESFVEFLNKHMIAGHRFADEFVVSLASDEELKRVAEDGHNYTEK
ncbi:MAG: hypothetical protein HGA41_00025 [Syntrophaceae bacterium]|nr:hypothetical protein [Syntrophaceae bacterium]